MYERKFGCEFNKDDLLYKFSELIEKIKTLVDLPNHSKDIVLEVMIGIKSLIIYGFTPHTLTKEKIINAINIFEDLAKLESKNDNERKTIEMCAELARNAITNNNSLPSERNLRRL